MSDQGTTTEDQVQPNPDDVGSVTKSPQPGQNDLAPATPDTTTQPKADDDLPSFSDIRGQQEKLPSFDDIRKQQPSTAQNVVESVLEPLPQMAHWFGNKVGLNIGPALTPVQREVAMQNTGAGRIAEVFGDDFIKGVEESDFAQSNHAKILLDQADYKKYLEDIDVTNKGLYDGLILPGAHNTVSFINGWAAKVKLPIEEGLYDAIIAGPSAAFQGLAGQGADTGALGQAGIEVGMPQLGRAAAEALDVSLAPEANLRHMTPFVHENAEMIANRERFRDVVKNIVADPIDSHTSGPGATEGTYFGTEKAPPQLVKSAQKIRSQLLASTPAESESVGLLTNHMARVRDPETFHEYDSLQARVEQSRMELERTKDEMFTNKLEALKAQREREGLSAAAKADLDRQISNVSAKEEEFKQNVDTAQTREIEKKIADAKSRMWELAPKVREAYQAAQPGEAEARPSEAPAQPIATAAQQRERVVTAVTDSLVAAGRPQAEAEHTAQVVYAHYQAMADLHNGEKGTAEEFFNREFPQISKGRGSSAESKQEELAQLSTTGDNRAGDRNDQTSTAGNDAGTQGLQGRGELSGSTGLLAEPSGSNTVHDLPLAGAPGPVDVPGHGLIQFGPFRAARQAAAEYMAERGLRYAPPTRYAKVNKERAARIAQAFEDMKHEPNDPEVKAAYQAMIDETLAQYQKIKQTGLKIEAIDLSKMGDPYAKSPRLAILDVTQNNHLWFFPTDDGFGGSESANVDISGNPLLQMTNETLNGKPLRANDIFRIVHDYFGHIKDGNGFRAEGEENAWQSHAAMYTPQARRAMTVETRGQNSWVNFGKFAEQNKTASAAETQYAPQKIGLMPEWVSEEGRHSAFELTPKEHAVTANDLLNAPRQRPTNAMKSQGGIKAIGAELEARGNKARRALGIGKITGPDPKTDAMLTKWISAEVKAAMARGGKTALEWYRNSISTAMNVASIVHPELATDQNAQMAYRLSLAVTSQGERVGRNFTLAEQAYTQFKETGKFPTTVKTKDPSIGKNFEKLNALLDSMGPDALRQFLHREYTVKELADMGHPIKKELADEKVYGSAILGSKIGQGFYQNLSGNFHPVTMDMWFMRSWGRLTGTLIGNDLTAPRARLEAALAAEGIKVPKTVNGLLKLSQKLETAHERDFKANRALFDSGEKEKSELSKAAEAFTHNAIGLNDTPGSGGDRKWKRDIINQVRENLAQEGIYADNAQIQAMWWYPEKSLYDRMGGDSEVKNNTDYGEAAIEMAKERGATDEDIQAALLRADQRRPERGPDRNVAGADAFVRPEGQGEPERLSPLEQAKNASITPDFKFIKIFQRANVTSALHELTHKFVDEVVRYATMEDAPAQLKKMHQQLKDFVGEKNIGGPYSGFTRAGHERIARAAERYFMEGVAPSKDLAKVFWNFRNWILKLSDAFGISKRPLTPEMRDFFDHLYAAKPERTVYAPEHEPGEMMANIHDMDEKATTDPEDADRLGDHTRAEIDATAQQHAPEVYDALKAAEANASAQPTSSTSETQSGGQSTGQAGTPRTSAAVPAVGDQSPSEGDASGRRNVTGTNSAAERDKFIGNINMEKIVGGDGFEEAVRQAAANNDDFMANRRGVMSKGEVIDLADFLGRNPAFLDKKKIGDAFSAEEIVAAKQLLIRAYGEVKEAAAASRLAQESGVGREEAAINLAKAIATHEYFQSKVAQGAAEAGRALWAHRMVVSEAANSMNLSAFLKENTGRDLNQLEQMAKFMDDLNQSQASKFIHDTAKGGVMMKVKNGILYYYINSLLSGPFTHARYVVGNELKSVLARPIETGMAATYGHAENFGRRLLGKEEVEQVYYREVGHQLAGWWMGHADGFYAATKAWGAGYSEQLPGEEPFAGPQLSNVPMATKAGVVPAIVKGYGAPSRAVAAIHSMNKTISYVQGIYSLAARMATEEGLTGDAYAARIAELRQSPTEEMMQKASSAALEQMYMGPTEYNSFMGGITRAFDQNFFAKMLIPFMKIGSKITKEAFIQGSPLGMFTKGFWEDMQAGGTVRQERLARMSVGTGVMATGFMLTKTGVMTGDGPSDPNARALWLLTHTPNSITIGSICVPYSGLGSLGMQLRFAANMAQTSDLIGKDDASKLMMSALEGLNKSVIDDNFMRGAKDMLDAVYHYQEYGDRYIHSMASNFMPWSVGMAQVSRHIDPNMREVHTTQEAMQQKIPFKSEELFPRRDRFGEPIPNGGPDGRYNADPVVMKLSQLGMGISNTPKEIRGVKLTEQQYDEFSMLAGRLTKQRLNIIVNSPSFSKNAPGEQMLMIKRVVDGAREQIRAVMMHQYPQIRIDAAKKKLSH